MRLALASACLVALSLAAPLSEPTPSPLLQRDFFSDVTKLIDTLLSFGTDFFQSIFGGLFQDGLPQSCRKVNPIDEAISSAIGKLANWDEEVGPDLDKCRKELSQRLHDDFMAKAHSDTAADEGIQGDSDADFQDWIRRQVKEASKAIDQEKILNRLGEEAGKLLRGLLGGSKKEAENEDAAGNATSSGGGGGDGNVLIKRLGAETGKLLQSLFSKDDEGERMEAGAGVTDHFGNAIEPSDTPPEKGDGGLLSSVFSFVGGLIKG